MGTATGMALASGHVMREAVELARDGEIGNSNAIRLLQIPHTPEELKEVLRRFDRELTREARAKLALAAYAPLPPHVENQRYEPIFERYPISGRLYTTASGTVVLNEVQYYNGVMVQLYGECTDVAGVRDALRGSGHKPLLLRYADGRETAVAHFWSHNLTDTSLWPYNAMFVIIAVVPDCTPSHLASLRADENGASSVLSALDGAYDAARGVYENRARFYYHRLLDSTKVAIEVGRERMGTDKRPGTIDLTRAGSRIGFSVKDGARRPVASVDVVVAADPAAYLPEVARAAATAGVAFGGRPSGTEYVFPSVARIGDGPVVTWDWRTDVQPRLQPVRPGMAYFDSSSDVGATLNGWGFQPKVLGYLPHVRGVVTGVPDRPPARPLNVRIRAAAR
jgi:hypothetical protein